MTLHSYWLKEWKLWLRRSGVLALSLWMKIVDWLELYGERSLPISGIAPATIEYRVYLIKHPLLVG